MCSQGMDRQISVVLVIEDGLETEALETLLVEQGQWSCVLIMPLVSVASFFQFIQHQLALAVVAERESEATPLLQKAGYVEGGAKMPLSLEGKVSFWM